NRFHFNSRAPRSGLQYSSTASPTLREILFAHLETLFSFRRAQRLHALFSSVENSSRGQPDVDQIVPVLPRENEVVFPAVEATAQEWAAVVNRAAILAEIDALAAPVRGKGENGIAAGPLAQDLILVRFDVVPLIRIKDKPLI